MMVSKLAFELAPSSKSSRLVLASKFAMLILIRFSKQYRIPYTASDRVLTQKAYELFDQLYQRRQLVRLIGVKV